MKNFRLLSAILLFSFAHQAYGQDKALNTQNWSAKSQAVLHALTFDLFRDKKNVPADIKPILDAHSKELQELARELDTQGCLFQHHHHGYGVRQIEWLPGYFIKHGKERYENAKRLELFIAKNRLKLISAPEKFLYPVPDRPNEFLVIAKKANGKHLHNLEELTVRQQSELDRIATALPHRDLDMGNFVVADNGTITIVDTDYYAMPKSRTKRIMPDFCVF